MNLKVKRESGRFLCLGEQKLEAFVFVEAVDMMFIMISPCANVHS